MFSLHLTLLFSFASALPQPVETEVSSNATLTAPTKPIPPQCVDARIYPEWSTRTSVQLDAPTCLDAFAQLQRKVGPAPERGAEKVFWSKKIFRREEKCPISGVKVSLPDGAQNRKLPSPLPYKDFPLIRGRPAKGEVSIAINKGICTVLVRMRSDFDLFSLPFGHQPPSRHAPSYYPAGPGVALAYQEDTWTNVFHAMNDLLNGCARQGMPGWATAGNDIVVAIWPRGTVMDQRFGLVADKLEGGGGESLAGDGGFGGGLSGVATA